MKRILTILSLLMLIITIININSTYSKYYTEVNGQYQREVGKWKIKVNQKEIYSEDGQTENFTIEPAMEEKQNTKSGKIAPGTELYADIDIDPSETDVVVRYDMKLNCEQLQGMPITLEINKINIGNELIKTGIDTYTAIIPLENIRAKEIQKIRLTFKWENNELQNENDTEKGKIYGNKVEIPVEITFTQYLGEEITPYTE